MRNWNSKKTGKPTQALVLGCLRKEEGIYGIGAREEYIYADKPAFKSVFNSVNGALCNIVNRHATVYYNKWGEVENVVFGEQIPDLSEVLDLFGFEKDKIPPDAPVFS